MKTIGIILIIFQIISLYGGFPSASFGSGSMYALSFYLGYFFPGIIGVFLLIKGSKKKTNSKDTQ